MKNKLRETDMQLSKLKPDISKIITEIVQEEYLYTHKEVRAALAERQVYISQSMISRYFQSLNIMKNQKGKPYQVSSKTHLHIHLDALHNLMEENRPILHSNVSIQFVQIGSGMASVCAYHLREAFPDVLLETEIKKDFLILYINLDADTDTFFELLNRMNEE